MMREAPNSPVLSPVWGLPPSLTFTKNDPTIETIMPAAAMTSGSITAAMVEIPMASNTGTNAAPRTMVPMIEPT